MPWRHGMLTPDAQALTKWHNNLCPDDLTTDCRLQVGLAVDRVYDAAKVLKNFFKILSDSET